jgi:hypothetical protein
MERQTITIDRQVAEWLEKQPKKRDVRKWESDPLTDAKILAGWPVMTKKDLAASIGICDGTIRRRYLELTGKR